MFLILFTDSSNNATKKEILEQFKNIQNTPLPDPNSRKKALASQVMPSSQRRRQSSKTVPGFPITPIAEENEQFQAAKNELPQLAKNNQSQSGKSTSKELLELLQKCREELGALDSTGMGQSPGGVPPNKNSNVETVVENELRLYKSLSKTDKSCETEKKPSTSISSEPEKGPSQVIRL